MVRFKTGTILCVTAVFISMIFVSTLLAGEIDLTYSSFSQTGDDTINIRNIYIPDMDMYFNVDFEWDTSTNMFVYYSYEESDFSEETGFSRGNDTSVAGTWNLIYTWDNTTSGTVSGRVNVYIFDDGSFETTMSDYGEWSTWESSGNRYIKLKFDTGGRPTYKGEYTDSTMSGTMWTSAVDTGTWSATRLSDFTDTDVLLDDTRDGPGANGE